MVTERGAIAHLIKSDMGTLEGAQQVIDLVLAKTDRLDLLVHCAVDTTAGGAALEFDLVAFARAVQCNGSAMLALAQGLLPVLCRGSSLIFVTSLGSRAAVPGYVGVGAPKALGETIMTYLAVELAPRGVRANTVMGSAMDTDAIRSALPAGEAEARLQRAADLNPSGRRIVIEELGDAIEFLASNKAIMIQGQRLTVDGGFYLR